MGSLGERLVPSSPLRHGLRIHVEETHKLTSRIYWAHGLSEEQVIAIWEGKLGYRRAERVADRAADAGAGAWLSTPTPNPSERSTRPR
jgi:hypothetical protein